jgi:starvation-inducible DNA-binding protein
MQKKNTKSKPAASKAKPSMAGYLAEILADTYVLGVKTHGYHWNVVGANFTEMHEFFGKQYGALFEAADELAEHIRALGVETPAAMTSFLALTAIKESVGKENTVKAMLQDLVKSHEIIEERIHVAIHAADAMDDEVTEDLLIGRLAAHQKMMWMLKAYLQ